jgi:glycosyltransferase involved in cell wall biosynthesis
MKIYSNRVTPVILSIVTITKNDALGFERTSRSVERFVGNSQEIEWIVINAGDAMESLPSGIQNKILINEVDKGPFFGMNKGLDKTQGKFVNFMNSGDTVVACASVAEMLDLFKNTESSWLVANAQKKSSKGVENWKIPKKLIFKFWLGLNSFPHQSTFYRGDIIRGQGGFNACNKTADYETSLRFFKFSKPMRLNMVYSENSSGGISDQLPAITKARAITCSHQNVFPFVKKIRTIDLIFTYLFLKISALNRNNEARF